MTDKGGQAAKTVRLVPIPSEAMLAMLDGDLAKASAVAGVELTRHFLHDDLMFVWHLRVDQARDPEEARWLASAVVAEPEGIVVGHGGFHGSPDENGMVEMGYSVDPGHRRQGYAKAIVRHLLDWAAAEERVSTVRASIRPDNAASLATIAGFGFEETGEQEDEVDGREIIFEVAV